MLFRSHFSLSLSPFFSAKRIMSKMKVIAMKQSAMHRLTRIRLEAVRRLENLQNALISRKFALIQITVKMTLMLKKMLRCRSGFWQSFSEELMELLKQSIVYSNCVPTTDLFSSNRLYPNKVTFGNVALLNVFFFSVTFLR